MNLLWIWVPIFGIVGVTSRFAIDLWVTRWSLAAPIGTFLINAVGCLIAGFIIGIAPNKSVTNESLRLGIMIGFCGGFTTMSGFSVQVVQLINSGKISQALAYGIGSPIFCLLAVIAGLVLARIAT